MHRASIAISVLVMVGAIAAACSNANDADKPLPLGDDNYDAGDSGKDAANALPDGGDEADADIGDARDELIPIDADRGGDSGSGGPVDGGDEDDAPVEPECIFDEDCAGKLTLGICERVLCVEQACTKAHAKIGTICEDGEVCTQGDSCDGNGVCVSGLLDDRNEDCVAKPTPNALWFTEVMGVPRAIEGLVADEDAQWIEVVVRGLKAVSLDRAALVYYDWPDNEPEPQNPEPTIARLQGLLLPSEPQLLVRSNNPYSNGNLRGAVEYAKIAFGRDNRNARLLLIGPDWKPAPGEVFAVPAEYVIDSILLPAGTFSEAHKGRSWQVSEPLPPSSEERTWCHTPADSVNAYVEEGALKNYGTPARSNVACP